MKEIVIIGARKHNLKNLDIRIPKHKMVVITGVSGSGKSSLAYDTIFQEGQRKYLESLSIYARQFIKSLEKPDVQYIKGISPTISIDQKHASYFFNSTVGTISEVSQYLRLLYAKVAQAFCPECGRRVDRFSPNKIMDLVSAHYQGKKVQILAPVVKNRKGIYRILFEKYVKKGFLKALVDGMMVDLDPIPNLDRHNTHHISILIDWLAVEAKNRSQLNESISLAMAEGNGEIIIASGNHKSLFSDRLFCSNCDLALNEPQPATFSFTSPIGYCPRCYGMGADPRGNSCGDCQGSGYNREALSFRFRDKNIFELGEMEIKDLLFFLKKTKFSREEEKIVGQIFPHIIQRLESFVRLNLDYMTLNRKVSSLSGGELQRTRLVSQIGFGLSGIIYILDEPSIGMHMAEQNNLILILKELINKDNTVIVVEHDENTINSSDFIIDLGPGAGEKGGNLVFSGKLSDFHNISGSLTADYLYNRKKIAIQKKYQPEFDRLLRFKGVSINNIKRANIKIPLQALTVVTGVSGSGKSSLIIDAIYQIMRNFIEKKQKEGIRENVVYAGVEGGDLIQRVIMVDQSSIGKNSRSCPATYVDLMPIIRDFFANLTESRARGYDRSRFSFNVTGGRCEACNGLGIKKIEMSFLPQLEVECPVCDGKRYNSETLKVRYKGLSIADVLDLTANEAYDFFRNIPFLAKKILLLKEVGLGYLKLGQSSVTLSGGESQRIKLCKELSKISSRSTLYVLDEPTIGLHFDDIQKLIEVFHSLIMKRNTIVVIEHNMEIIKTADYIIDLGPGGGHRGGEILYQGQLMGILDCHRSLTAEYLSQKLKHAI